MSYALVPILYALHSGNNKNNWKGSQHSNWSQCRRQSSLKGQLQYYQCCCHSNDVILKRGHTGTESSELGYVQLSVDSLFYMFSECWGGILVAMIVIPTLKFYG